MGLSAKEQDRLTDLHRLAKERGAQLGEAAEVITAQSTEVSKQKSARERLQKTIDDLTSTERALVSLLGGGASGGVVGLGVGYSVDLIGKHSASVANNAGYIKGGVKILLGGATFGTALYLQGTQPGLASAVAISGGGTLVTWGIAQTISTAWTARKKAQAQAQLLQERLAASEAAAAAVAQQQQQAG